MKNNGLMKKVRTFIVGILGGIAWILICSEPVEEETWFLVFFATRVGALLIGGVAYALFVRWKSKGLLFEFEIDDEV